MRNQQGFGLIEVLVAMSLLSVATLAIVKWFGMQKSSDANIVTATKNLQDQRILERFIWTKYANRNISEDSGALPNCDIRSGSTSQQISLASDGDACEIAVVDPAKKGCIGNSLWAEVKQLSDSECVFSNLSSQVLTVSSCSDSSISEYAKNINNLTNKSDFLVMLWDSNNNATTCTLANTVTPASADETGGTLELTLSSACTINVSTANSAAVRLPKYSVRLLGNFESKDDDVCKYRDDGYKRFYY